jgi:hypothetical protein
MDNYSVLKRFLLYLEFIVGEDQSLNFFDKELFIMLRWFISDWKDWMSLSNNCGLEINFVSNDLWHELYFICYGLYIIALFRVFTKIFAFLSFTTHFTLNNLFDFNGLINKKYLKQRNYHLFSEVKVVSWASLRKVAVDLLPAIVSYKNELLPF